MNWCLWTVVLEKTLESPLDCKEIQPVYAKGDVMSVHWKDWCWGWSSNTLATRCKELTHLKRPWCWERLKVGGEGDDRGWDGWVASLMWWTWVWVNSGSWWWTGRPGMLQSMGLQRVVHDWATELNWTQVKSLSRVRLFATPWTLAYQAPPSMGFSRQEDCSGLPFPFPGGLSDPGMNPGLQHCRQTLLPSEPPGNWCLHEPDTVLDTEHPTVAKVRPQLMV